MIKSIDNLVAEEVMGWEIFEKEVATYWVDNKGDWTLRQLWKPSTNMRDAWEIVEYLEQHPKFKEIQVTRVNGTTYVSIDEYFGDSFERLKGRHQSKSDSAPLAITLAALKARGIDVE